MNKYNDFKCFIGLHQNEFFREDTLTDIRGNKIGKVIISICKNCGKIKQTRIITVNEHI